MKNLILYYDNFHTPLDQLKAHLDPETTRFLVIDLGAGKSGYPATVDDNFDKYFPTVFVDGKEKYFSDVLCQAIKAHARYQGGYYLSAALSRAVQVMICCQVINDLDIDRVIHGFAGNDQLRFEMGVGAVSSSTTINSSAQILGSQNEVNDNVYSISDNMWGISYESADLSDPLNLSLNHILPQSHTSESIESEIHKIGFEKGVPVELDDVSTAGVDLIQCLNEIGEKYGVGISDVVEDGFIGLKTRSVYFHPAAHALIEAHRDLERYVCTGRQNNYKTGVDQAWSELVYQGGWFDPQRESLNEYIDSLNKYVTGTVVLIYSLGSVRVIGRTSPFSIFKESLAIHRIGQDISVNGVGETAKLLSIGSRVAFTREKCNEM